MKHTGRMWTTLGVALVVVLHVNADDVCPDTVSQGGGNAANASFILHDSVGGVGGKQRQLPVELWLFATGPVRLQLCAL